MRYELTDYEWFAIKPLLPNKPRGVPRVDDRRVLNGIFWVLRTGAPWRELPGSFGPYTTSYNRFVRWRRAGVWSRIWKSGLIILKPQNHTSSIRAPGAPFAKSPYVKTSSSIGQRCVDKDHRLSLPTSSSAFHEPAEQRCYGASGEDNGTIVAPANQWSAPCQS
jgi:Putative transposase of IS4/5 family (DUF4096)